MVSQTQSSLSVIRIDKCMKKIIWEYQFDWKRWKNKPRNQNGIGVTANPQPFHQRHQDVFLFSSFNISSDNSSALYSTPKHLTTSILGFNKYLIVFIVNVYVKSKHINLQNNKRVERGLTCCGKSQQDNHHPPLLPS